MDSEPVANRLFAEALQQIGLDWTFEDVSARFVGRTMGDCIVLIEAELGRPVPDNFLDRLQERMFAAFRESLQPVPGVRAAIERLGLPDCVASSGEIEKMRLTLGITDLLPHFRDRLFSAEQVPRGKPHPDLFLHAARELGHDPAVCAVIEDSVPGVQAGVAAGMRVFGYAAHGNAERLAEAGATPFKDMADLPGLLGR